VAARLETVPGVRSASVSVRWPRTLVVEIDERVAAAAVPVDGGLRLVDEQGFDLGVVPAAPQGVLRVVAADASGAAVRVEGAGVAAAVSVRAQLPAALGAEVTAVGATSADGVWFRLRDGATVVWGSAGRGADKADVLAVLRSATPGAARYDVSAPDAPAVTPR
jgi:cell division protein FtsQ